MNIDFDFERDCHVCDGSGRRRVYGYNPDKPDPCTYCEGHGKVLTAEGRRLGDFLKKYFGLRAPPTVRNHNDEELPNPLYEE